jgi:hypothetical protein
VLADKVRVLERGSDLVLAAHLTPLGGRLGLVAQTVETVRFTRPERVDFRLVRGPVPHVVATRRHELMGRADGASAVPALGGVVLGLPALGGFDAGAGVAGQAGDRLVAGLGHQHRR